MKPLQIAVVAFSTLCSQAYGAPSDEAVRRFVQISEVGESAVLAYAATAGSQQKLAKAKCESQAVLASRDIFHEWAVIATRTVFQHDADGKELDRVLALLETKDGMDFIAAKAHMQAELTKGVPIAEAGAAMRARLSHMPREMSQPIIRVGEVSNLLSDPRRLQQWRRYNELVARLNQCSTAR